MIRATPTVNFHGERRSNQTHQSTTDPDCRLCTKAKGHEAKLAYLGEVLMENRHGLVVDAYVVPPTGTGERNAAGSLVASLPARRVTVGGDKGYDTRDFVATLRARDATRHIAQRAKTHTLDADHVTRRLSVESTRAETHRRGLWLDERASAASANCAIEVAIA